MALAGCGAQGQQAGAPLGLQPNRASTGGLHLYHLVSSANVKADIALRSSGALPESSIRFQRRHGPEHLSQRAAESNSQLCPSIPPIEIVNPFFFPITIRLESFVLNVPCTGLFGASIFQSNPQPAVVSPQKLGDANANGSTITFKPSAMSVTLQPHTTYELLVLPETSTSDVAFPVVPSGTTNLTANAPAITSRATFNGLTFTYATSSGATAYSAACFEAFVNGQLVPFLQNVPLVGTPSFYCQLSTPNNAAITFGQTVNFNVLAPPPDRAIFEPDGNPQGFACGLPANNASTCNVPQFSIPTTYQNFIVGNVQDLRLCVPATPNVDCNNFGNDPQGGSLTMVPCCKEFQLLVADDPTYQPPTSSAQPWDGLFRKSFTPGICEASTASDNDNGDAPPGYSDNEQKGTGPAAELDVKPLSPGTCTITVTEDSRYIVDDSNPSNPQPRSATLAITI
ncbi:MAG: hypothetical protein JO092_06865, partial [Candidatus Eremiobacteraeota bacterium]|nr:hypothetical protein [Candidatus Eremiobacteraeota bacterium]